MTVVNAVGNSNRKRSEENITKIFVSFCEIEISVLGDLGLLNLRYKHELYLASKLP